jgi:hypothetical protein
VDEEKEWDSNHAKVDVDALSESGEESEEHDLDDVCFYSDDNNNDDVDNIPCNINCESSIPETLG